jgi:hypothetical protein
MDFKPHEIALMTLAVLVPAVLLVLAFIPGGLNWIGDFAMHPTYRPFVFFGGAAIAFAVLAWRIYRRIRPAEKKKPAAKVPHVSPTKMPKVEGSQAVERLKNRKQ